MEGVAKRRDFEVCPVGGCRQRRYPLRLRRSWKSMEELPNCLSAYTSVVERPLEQSASSLSVRRLAEQLSNELKFDRLRFASGATFGWNLQPDCPKYHKSSSLPDPSPPSTPSPLCHPLNNYADADSASAASPPAVPFAPPRAPPPPPPPPPPRAILNPPPSRRLPAIYATVYSPPSSHSSSPSPPSILQHYPRSLFSSPCPSLKSSIHPSPTAFPPAPGLPSHLRHFSQSALNSLVSKDEDEQKRTPDALLDRAEESPSVAEQDVKEELEVVGATTATSRVCLDVHDGGEDAEQPIQYCGDARSFIMDRFLPAARAVAEGDPPSASSINFAVNPCAPVARRRRSSSLIEPNIADELNVDVRKSNGSQPNVTVAHPNSAKTRGFRARAAGLYQRDDVAGKGGLFKSCGFLCLGLKTGVVHGCRRAVSSARSVSAPKNKAISPRCVDDFSEFKKKTIPAQSVDFFCEPESRPLPSRYVDVVDQGGPTRSDEEDATVREVKGTLLNRHNQSYEPTPASPAFSGSLKHVSFRGSPSRSGASFKESSRKYGTSSRGSPAHEDASARSVARPLHSQVDSNTNSLECGTSSRGSPVHEASTRFVASPLHSQADSINNSHEYGTSSRGSPVHEASTRFVASSLHSQADSEVDEPYQFYDAPSRFGSQASTPVHATSFGNGTSISFLNEAEGISGWTQDWPNDGTVSEDGIFSRFETPHTSESDEKSLQSESGYSREGWFSPESIGPKSSRLSQRVGKVLRVDTGGNQQGMQEMNGFSARLSGQGVPADHSFLTELEQVLELRNGSFSRLVTPLSPKKNGHKGSLKPGLVSPILTPKCQNRGKGKGVSERKPPDGMGWPLGIASYYTDSALKSSQLEHKSNAQYVQGADVPVPPLPPAPSGSWLKKAISSNSSKSSPSAAFKRGFAKKKPQFSSTDTARMRWECMVKSSHVQPGHLRFSEELLHHRPS